MSLVQREDLTQQESQERNRREREVRRLAYQLREGRVAELGLGFALRTLDPGVVVDELRRPRRFGARCRHHAVLVTGIDERAAWTILAAAELGSIRRRLERDGLLATGVARSGVRVLPLHRRRAGFGHAPATGKASVAGTDGATHSDLAEAA